MIIPEKSLEVIVVGGGHAGTEAALASARMGANTLLLTHDLDKLGQLSCNPAIGGIGKSILVREIDALGGVMAQAADQAGIHYRILNTSKGPAVRATRVQVDRALYKQAIRSFLEKQANLWLLQQAVEDLILKDDHVIGVMTQMGWTILAQRVILTTGTFLAGKIYVGRHHYAAGRAGDPSAQSLAACLHSLPLSIRRLKTGTPPRIDGRTIDFTQLTSQEGQHPPPHCSFTAPHFHRPQQVACYMTHTNERTHEYIRLGLADSPIYSGDITGPGPRYCPSIEDKIHKFAGRTAHQIFIEPEGLTTNEWYPNGISTSLPFETQLKFVRSIRGLKDAVITRPGYAIEYDFCDPRYLQPSLETKTIHHLFFAGQINGTTGYEEAAAQGLIAGINAVRSLKKQPAWIPRRDQAYIGVLIDDLVTQGIQEPYRMFTSRAEYRLLLREDNADLRLIPIAHELGLISNTVLNALLNKKSIIEREIKRLQSIVIHPHTTLCHQLESLLGQPLPHEIHALELLHRINYCTLTTILDSPPSTIPSPVAEQIEIQTKYGGYIARQAIQISQYLRQEKTLLPDTLDYPQIIGLSKEACEQLSQIRPTTIGMASRIPGITPATISCLLVHLKKINALEPAFITESSIEKNENEEK